MNISEFRAQYPQYEDMSDDQLAQSLHSKHYADMDYGEFSQKFLGKPKTSLQNFSSATETGAFSRPDERQLNPSVTRDVLGQTAKDVGTMISNVPGSAFDLAKNTVVGAGKLAASALIPEGLKPESVQEFDRSITEAGRHPIETGKAIISALGERYGSPEAVKNTLLTDPTGAALDIGGAMFGGGQLVRGAGTLGKVGSLTKAGEALAEAGGKIATAPVTLPVKAAVKVGRPIARGGATVGKQVLGATTGAGPGAIEEALKASPEFTKALRGEISGEEIVGNARTALNSLKEQRGAAYREQLAAISENKAPINMAPIRSRLDTMMERYGIRRAPDGKLDFSRSALGRAGSKDAQAVIEDIMDWGSQPGDNTAVGLDTLKRRLDDFYSDSSKAREFVATMRSEVKNTISNNVPEYDNMTKGYSEATRLIKDIESGLMMKKQGLTGRVTSDQTLRRLTSAMRENFELRKDLVDALGEGADQNLAGQIAGYSMSQAIPRGLVGKLSAGSAGYLAYLNPKLWPLIAASSPRVVGEFLNTYGKIKNTLGKAVAKAPEAANPLEGDTSGILPPRLALPAPEPKLIEGPGSINMGVRVGEPFGTPTPRPKIPPKQLPAPRAFVPDNRQATLREIGNISAQENRPLQGPTPRRGTFPLGKTYSKPASEPTIIGNEAVKPPTKPKGPENIAEGSLADFVISRGGIKSIGGMADDLRGEIQRMSSKEGSVKPGVFNNKGFGVDQMLEQAKSAGLVPEDTNPGDFLYMLERGSIKPKRGRNPYDTARTADASEPAGNLGVGTKIKTGNDTYKVIGFDDAAGQVIVRDGMTLKLDPWESISDKEAEIRAKPKNILPDKIEMKPQTEDYVNAYIKQYEKGDPGITRELTRKDGSGEIVLRNNRGQVVGVLAHSPKEITDIVVNKKYRREGIATELYNYAKSVGISKFKGPFSEQGLEFAKKMQDKQIKRKPNPYSR